MPQYVEENYSDNYVEGDTALPDFVPTECDLSAVMNELSTVKAQNVALNTKLDTLLTAINSNKTLSLAINDKLISLDTDIANIPQTDISSLVTKDYIDNKVPFVDDKSLIIYPNGSEVLTSISGGLFIVESSKFLPLSEYDFTVVYTLSKEIDGVKKYSDFNSKYVILNDEELYMRISDCQSSNGS